MRLVAIRGKIFEVARTRAIAIVVLGLLAQVPRVRADESAYLRRRYLVKLPKGGGAKHPAPLVLAVHCYGCDAESFRRWFGLDSIADERGFVLVVPEGKLDARDRRFFAATESCCDFDGRGVDDVGWLTWVIGQVRARYAIDPKRIFVLGYSNGGFMAHRLACDRAGLVAAVASLAGGAPVDCAPAEPVAVLEIHGDADEVVPYGGGHLIGLPRMPALPSVRKTIDTWARLNRCTTVETETRGLVTVERHGGCRAAVELWTVHGGRHVPEARPSGLARAFDFLLSHPKP